MNMAGINPAVGGGPVGGGNMMMNNTGSPAVSGTASNPDQIKVLLNTYIYEYFLKHGHFDVARALVKEEKFDMRTSSKQSPGRRKDGEMNGADESMDMDLKDDIPDDLPRPFTFMDSGHQSSGFLFEWFAVFSDIFTAHRAQNKMPGVVTPATQYVMQQQQQLRMRENQQSMNSIRPNMMPNQYAAAMRAGQMRNGMVNGEMAKRMTAQQLQVMQQNSQKSAMQQQAMARGEQPDGDPNARPGTPADGENGGSPSKRPRLDGQQQFNGGMMPNGRAGMPAGQPNMMIQAGFNPNMNAAQFRQNGGMPPKAMAAGMAASNGMMNMANSSSPMMQGMNQFPEGIPPEMYANRNPGMPQVMQGGPNGQSGNHALQDYQMQLMLLEQQNKKRLMMARQEQHENTNPRDGPPMPGGVNMAPGMSPSGNRTSPNPNEQMKRNAQMGGMPGSPSAGDMQGRSPANMGFMNGMQQEYNAMMIGGPPANMRPPTSVDINQMNRQQQQNRMAGQFQGGQPMVQQPSQGQPQPIGTPGQRNEMPPPTVPAATNSAQRNNQPASPANSNNAPPTPSQTNKANPKAKKGKDDTNRKRPQKKNSTANAPNTEDPPATPNPSTPITPVHPGSFNNSATKGQASGVQQPNPAAQQSQQMQPAQQLQQPDLGQNNAFPEFSGPEQNFNLDFSTLENTDVLENFDFDSFLNTSADDAFNFDAGMGVETFGLDGSAE